LKGFTQASDHLTDKISVFGKYVFPV